MGGRCLSSHTECLFFPIFIKCLFNSAIEHSMYFLLLPWKAALYSVVSSTSVSGPQSALSIMPARPLGSVRADTTVLPPQRSLLLHMSYVDLESALHFLLVSDLSTKKHKTSFTLLIAWVALIRAILSFLCSNIFCMRCILVFSTVYFISAV